MTGNASSSQYGPTPTPSCIACAPPQPLPHTGADLFAEFGLGAMCLTLAVVVIAIQRRWK